MRSEIEAAFTSRRSGTWEEYLREALVILEYSTEDQLRAALSGINSSNEPAQANFGTRGEVARMMYKSYANAMDSRSLAIFVRQAVNELIESTEFMNRFTDVQLGSPESRAAFKGFMSTNVDETVRITLQSQQDNHQDVPPVLEPPPRSWGSSSDEKRSKTPYEVAPAPLPLNRHNRSNRDPSDSGPDSNNSYVTNI